MCVCLCLCTITFRKAHDMCSKVAFRLCPFHAKLLAFGCFWSNTFLLTPTASKHFVHQIHIITRIGHVIVEYYNVSDVSANSIQALHGCILKLHNII
jgi:hypothetical protein